MARYSATVTVRMSASLRRSLEQQAKAERRSVASLCRRLLAAQVAPVDQPCLFLAPCPHPLGRRYRDRCLECSEVVTAA